MVLASPPPRPPRWCEHSNSKSIKRISFKFYMRVDTPMRFVAIEIWYPPRTRTTAFAAKRHSFIYMIWFLTGKKRKVRQANKGDILVDTSVFGELVTGAGIVLKAGNKHNELSMSSLMCPWVYLADINIFILIVCDEYIHGEGGNNGFVIVTCVTVTRWVSSAGLDGRATV